MQAMPPDDVTSGSWIRTQMPLLAGTNCQQPCPGESSVTYGVHNGTVGRMYLSVIWGRIIVACSTIPY